MFKRLNAWLQKAMDGRYGTDQLNMVILVGAMILSVVGAIARIPVMTLLAWIPLVWATFRMLSKNTNKRYYENRRFWSFWGRLRDREHRYFTCPKCHQTVRVPRGRGKISIHCPRCKEVFEKKS